MEALLARIFRLDPELHAFVHVDAEGALAAADSADREASAGRRRGPLHGIPVGIKDVIDVCDLHTTCHSRILIDNRASRDAHLVGRLRDAGAIVMGKLSTHEFAFGGPSFDLPFPPARNPWAADHHPGGSSSGAGASLAAGLLPLAIGTDAAGSIRSPASGCGVVGLKPTYGLVSRRGAFPLSFTLDHLGPMARSVADAALLLDAISGHDPDDPYSIDAPARSFTATIEDGISSLRVGFVRHFHESDLPADPEVRQALDEAARVLTEEGADVVDVRLPPLSESLAVNRIIVACEAWALHRDWLRDRPQDYGAITRRRLMVGAFHSAEDYVNAQRKRAEITAQVNAVFERVDVLLCANSMDVPCRIDDATETARTHPRQARAVFNLTGHPAIAFMVGQSASGLPLSAQLVGRHFQDAEVLRVARAYERATEWLNLHPDL